MVRDFQVLPPMPSVRNGGSVNMHQVRSTTFMSIVCNHVHSTLMATLDYIDVPSCATRLQPQQSRESPSIVPEQKFTTKLPRPLSTRTRSSSSTQPQPPSPTKAAMNFIPQLLLTPAMNLPSVSSNPQTVSGSLLSTRDPLSIPITTTNFRRFVSRVGPVFWLQDRVEEVVMWKKGYKVTVMWIAVYAFICVFPTPLFLQADLHIIARLLSAVITVIATHNYSKRNAGYSVRHFIFGAYNSTAS
jgi:hypothetical protein